MKEFESKKMSLRFLSVAYNKLKKMPSLQNLTLLYELYLNDNHLEAIPEYLAKIDRLEILHL